MGISRCRIRLLSSYFCKLTGLGAKRAHHDAGLVLGHPFFRHWKDSKQSRLPLVETRHQLLPVGHVRHPLRPSSLSLSQMSLGLSDRVETRSPGVVGPVARVLDLQKPNLNREQGVRLWPPVLVSPLSGNSPSFGWVLLPWRYSSLLSCCSL